MGRRTPALLIIGAVIAIPIIGISLLVFTPLGQYLKDTIGEDYVVEKSVDFLVADGGLNEALTITYSDVEVEEFLYGSLWLMDITVADETVTTTYQYKAEYVQVSDVFDASSDRDFTCSEPLTRRFMAYGATFVDLYLDETGAEIGSVKTNANICGIELF